MTSTARHGATMITLQSDPSATSTPPHRRSAGSTRDRPAAEGFAESADVSQD
jgi:hypothetical protein